MAVMMNPILFMILFTYFKLLSSEFSKGFVNFVSKDPIVFLYSVKECLNFIF